MADIEFKSNEELFKKEKSGKKNNTIRYKDLDNRFMLLDDYAAGEIKDLTIKIINRQTSESFTRVVKDVTKVKNMYIITWEV